MSLNNQIRILALETSADETSAAVAIGSAKNGGARLTSNIIYSQIAVHRKTGGIVPEVAARAHLPKIIPAIKLALKKSKLSLRDIDCFAVTAGPGLITSLMVGVDTAKTLAFALGKPIVPVNHLEGHLLSALLTPSPREGRVGEGLFPALGLVVSGGHTLLVLIKHIGKYRILGQTLDDAAGECFDKVAKILGLPYPGGPALAKLAKSGNAEAIDFPRPMIDSKNYDFSFAGLKTAVLYFLRDLSRSATTLPRPGEGLGERSNLNTKYKILYSHIAASAEQAIIDVLVAKTLRAARQYKITTILLGGGVAANENLRQTLKSIIQKELPYSKFYIPHSNLTTDNAGMIALAGFYHYIHGHTTTFNKVKADPNLELTSWR